MNSKAILKITLIALSFMLLITVCHGAEADVRLNLPTDPVLIEVFNGTDNYFDIYVTHVPSGFSVVNGVYPGWCVDLRYLMPRSPATHWVWLFSSTNPPSDLLGQKWGMVNYILNHKQGSRQDIQQAIWYFMNGLSGYKPWTSKAWAMVRDAEANGTGFIPTGSQVTAVICYIPVPDIQLTVIEVHSANTVLVDLNGDRVVNIIDISIVLKAFGSRPGSPNWNSIADINHDDVVNIIDVTLVNRDYGMKLL